MSGETLKKAIEIVTKATEEDKAGNYDEALRLYEHGVEYFLHAIKYEAQGDKSKESIRQKCIQYLDRAEKLKTYVKNKNKKAVASVGGAKESKGCNCNGETQCAVGRRSRIRLGQGSPQRSCHSANQIPSFIYCHLVLENHTSPRQLQQKQTTQLLYQFLHLTWCPSGWEKVRVRLQWKAIVSFFKRQFGLLRLPRSFKSPSGFHLEKSTLICGDVESNPGPRSQVAVKFPCKQCGKAVRINQDAFLCEDCDTWAHRKCLASIFDDPDDRLWAWKILFDDTCNNHAPWKEVRIKSCAPPWLTNDIRFKMNERFKLFKVAMANRCPEAWSAYKRVCNSVTRALRKAKASYFTKMFGEVKNSTSYWNLVNRATNPKSRKTIGPIRRSDDSLALQDKDKATALNSYFATIGVGVDNKDVLVLGATNIPWTLDSAIRRRFEKRIYIPLPEASARVKMFELHMGNLKHSIEPGQLRELAEKTDGIVVRDAMMQPVRKVQQATHFKKVRGPSPNDPNIIMDDLLTPCSPGEPGAMELTWMQVPGEKLLEPLVNMTDMLRSLATSKPTVNSEDLKKFEDFTRDFGQEG
ncbi:Vacuolar protein sorting-associated protein 4B [Acropora cervicornis]|uniref:Vacuolar protein sorting-associated protein 4B n=1 Tax=Acropora cervicornis TaxID=6130 RepID=A0AAD9QE92_ACRCE|nr:Vacuolar protein sorting-associated protein 4B [Acropora cervicornis]